MARIQSETLVITFNRLVKEDAQDTPMVTEEIASALESVAQELIGAGVIVETLVA